MKGLIIITMIMSMGLQAEIITQKQCARRFIEASKDLVAIASDFNHGEISEKDYAASVAAVDAELVGMKMYCYFQDNRQASECAEATKPTYEKIRKKMYVKEVIKKNLNQVEVSEIDLLPLAKGTISGFFKKLKRGEKENICSLNADE